MRTRSHTKYPHSLEPNPEKAYHSRLAETMLNNFLYYPSSKQLKRTPPNPPRAPSDTPGLQNDLHAHAPCR